MKTLAKGVSALARQHLAFVSRMSIAVAISLLTPVTPFLFAQTFKYPAVQSQVTKPIDETQLTTLPGHVHPLAKVAADQGLVDDSMPVQHLMVLLQKSPQQQQAADLLIDQLQNRKSPLYHQWLTAQQFGQHFGPTDQDIAKLTAWLQSKGFTVEDVPPGRTHIVISGTAGMVRTAFHTAIHNLTVNGQPRKAVLSDPQIPTALAPIIKGLNRLYSWHPQPLHHLVVRPARNETPTAAASPAKKSIGVVPNFTNGNYYDVAPNDWYTIYNVSPIFSAGFTGAGQTVAVLEETEIVNQSDVTTFRSQFGLPAYPATPNPTSGGVNWLYGPGNGCLAPAMPTSVDEESEALIDTEWAGVAAPNATIDFVACQSTNSGIGSSGVDLAAAYVANYLYSTVVTTSLSYGECESDAGANETAYYAGIWQQMAAAGITAVVSSGDAGSMTCDQPAPNSTQSYAVNNLSSNAFASSPNNISAGGTDFSDSYQANGGSVSQYWNAQNDSSLSSAISYVPEMAWGGMCSSPIFSSFYQNTGDTQYGLTYTPEAICNNTTAQTNGLLQVIGGGGGTSVYTSIPSWQSAYGIGLTGNASSTTARNQPDIALFASPGLWSHALTFCQSDIPVGDGTYYSCDYTQSSNAAHLAAGGTSFVAPQVAGLMALINQYTSTRQGVANYTLYSLAASEYGVPNNPNNTNLSSCSGSMLGNTVGTNCTFLDIAATPNPAGGTIVSDTVQPCLYSAYLNQTTSNCYLSTVGDTYGLSSVTGSTFSDAYPTSSGYDLATGLGSLNAYNLLANWNNNVTFPSDTALTANPTTLTAQQSTTLTATVTATGRGATAPAAGTVTFYIGGATGAPVATAPLTQTCSAAPVTCAPPTATVSIPASQLNPGDNSIVAEFSGDAANDAPSISSAVTVTAPASNSNVVTLNATSVNSSSGLLNGSVNPQGSGGTVFFLYGTSASLSLTSSQTGPQYPNANSTAQSFGATLNNLASGTTYYYQFVFYNGTSYEYGAVLSFTTLQSTTATLAVRATNSSSATISGTVNTQGSGGTVFFLYGPSTNLTPGTSSQTGAQYPNASATTQAFSATLNNLLSGTTYYYQFVFQNGNNGQVQYGAVLSFKTQQTTIATLAARQITSSSGAFTGSVNTQGSGGNVFFLYGTSPTLILGTSSQTPNQYPNASTTTQSFGSPILDLLTNTTYYYQFVFENGNNGQVQYGAVLSFTTLQTTTTTLGTTILTSSSGGITGSVNTGGSGGLVFFLYGTSSSLTLNSSQTQGQNPNISYGTQTFVATLNNLATGTTYYYQLVYENQDNGEIQYGAVRSFKTLQTTATTLTATGITSSSGSFSGTTNPEGSSSTVFFLYGTSATLTLGTSSQTSNQYPNANTTTQTFSATLSGLTSGTTYYYQFVFENGNNGQVQYGSVQSFTTLQTSTSTLGATGITSSSGSFSGTANPEGSSSTVFFLYGTSATLALGTSSQTPNQYPNANTTTQTFSATLSGLTSGTTYYYQFVFENGNNGQVQYGSVQSFTTLQTSTSTLGATGITSSSGSFSGTANPEGSSSTVFFLYGTSATLTLGTSSQTTNQYPNVNTTTQTFSATLNGLASGTTYYYQFVFENGNNGQVQYGSVQSFTTLQTSTSTLGATGITSSSGSLNGTANPEGSSSTVFFLYGTSATLTLGTSNQTPNQYPNANTTTQTFSATLSGLTSGTTYYYQFVFENGNNGQLQYGAILSFQPGPGLGLIPITPCRLVDTRTTTNPLGGPTMTANSIRTFALPTGTCGLPTTASAYSLNVTVQPKSGKLGYLTIWPTGQTQPVVSTLNSLDGRVVANAAIVSAGTNGAVSVYVTDQTDVIIDVNGYFAPVTTAGALFFQPVTPCRVEDTRTTAGPFGGPVLAAASTRSFNIPGSNCSIPAAASAYSLNATVVPTTTLQYLTLFPTGTAQPMVSTLNSMNGQVVANAALVPAGTNGAISAYVTDQSQLITDINGYFSSAPPTPSVLRPVTPCRVVDTRTAAGTFGGPVMAAGSTRAFPIPTGACGIPSGATAYAVNVTAVPASKLKYLTLWPDGQGQPYVSTLNSYNGQVVANAAIVPAGNNGAVDVFVTDETQVIMDIVGYFIGNN